MAKRRSRKRQKTKRHSKKPATDESTSLIEMLAKRNAEAGPDDFADSFIHIMQRSATLRHEPEFADFYLDPMQTLEVTARHFPRFQRQMMQMLRRGEEPDATKYDNYRIAVLDDMDTPQLRQQLRRRLDRYTNRYKRKRGCDVAKLESALFLRVLLDEKANKLVGGKKPLPLGVYALVTVIYEDSFNRAMEEIPTARDIVGDELYGTWCAQHHREDMEAITTAVEQIDAFAELEERIEADPALALAWKRQELSLLKEYQTQISAGLRIEPGFFSPDEIALTMDKVEQRYLSKPWSPSRYFALVALRNFVKCARETLDEIVSPQRVAEIAVGLKSVGQHSLETNDERLRALLPHIQATIHCLRRIKIPSQNQILMTMYVSDFPQALSDMDTLSPGWQRLLKRLKKSRFAPRLANSMDDSSLSLESE